MAGKHDTFENEFMLHVFNNAALPLIGDAAGLQPSAVAGSFYCSLHTADPGETGNQATSEVVYGSYARVEKERSSAGWTVVNGIANPTGGIIWPACTSGSATATFFGVGTAESGTGKLLYSGAISTAIAITLAVVPTLTTITAIAED